MLRWKDGVAPPHAEEEVWLVVEVLRWTSVSDEVHAHDSFSAVALDLPAQTSQLLIMLLPVVSWRNLSIKQYEGCEQQVHRGSQIVEQYVFKCTRHFQQHSVSTRYGRVPITIVVIFHLRIMESHKYCYLQTHPSLISAIRSLDVTNPLFHLRKRITSVLSSRSCRTLLVTCRVVSAMCKNWFPFSGFQYGYLLLFFITLLFDYRFMLTQP